MYICIQPVDVNGEEEEEQVEKEMSEEEKHLRDVIQYAIGSELKQV